MKFIKILTVLCTLLVLSNANIFAQDIPIFKIKATVVGTDKKPITGANVSCSAENSQPTITDEQGTFMIDVPSDEVLSVSAKGYKTYHVTVIKPVSEIIMQVVQESDFVRLPFRDVEKRDLMSGVSQVDVKDLLDKNYFTFPLDGMESLVPGFNGNSNWGMGNYLFHVVIIYIHCLPSGEHL